MATTTFQIVYQKQILDVRKFRNTDYLTTSTGRIFSLKRGKLTELCINSKNRRSDEYIQVWIKFSTGGKIMYLHRIIAECWLEGFNKKLTVNHIDMNKKNNNVENLECISLTKNLKTYHQNKTTEYKRESRWFLDKKTNMIFKTKTDMNKYLNKSHIYAHYQFKHNPDRFVYIDDEKIVDLIKAKNIQSKIKDLLLN